MAQAHDERCVVGGLAVAAARWARLAWRFFYCCSAGWRCLAHAHKKRGNVRAGVVAGAQLPAVGRCLRCEPSGFVERRSRAGYVLLVIKVARSMMFSQAWALY